MGKMKKAITFLLTFAMVFMATLPALATTTAPPNTAFPIDWTQVVVWVIGVVGAALSGLLARTWTVHVKPWLVQKKLTESAGIVINAVEALLGRYCGEDKWRLALGKMQERGFDVDSDMVIDALKAAWADMNMNQIMVGMKEPVQNVG